VLILILLPVCLWC